MMQPREATPRPNRPTELQPPTEAPPEAPPDGASQEQLIAYLMERDAYLMERDAYLMERDAYQQSLNQYAMAQLSATRWDIADIHNKFNMREAMEDYEQGVFRLLEFDIGWSQEESGISPPARLADISYLRGHQYGVKRAQVNTYLTQFSSFTKYFNSLDDLLSAMKQWSTAFKQPATSFSHNDHPQHTEMREVLIGIGQQMSGLGLNNLHLDVITNSFPA